MVCEPSEQKKEELVKGLKQSGYFTHILAASCFVEKSESYDKYLQTFYSRKRKTIPSWVAFYI